MGDMNILNLLQSPLGWIVTTVFGLGLWRYQMIGKRRYEVAEQVLQATGKVVSALRFARGRVAFAGEGKTRPLEPNETKYETERRNALYVPIERLVKNTSVFDDLAKLVDLCAAHFGEDAAKPLSTLLSVQVQIAQTAYLLIDMTEDHELHTKEERETMRDLRQKLYDHNDDPENAITKQIETAHAEIKRVYVPYLRPGWLKLFLPFWDR